MTPKRMVKAACAVCIAALVSACAPTVPDVSSRGHMSLLDPISVTPRIAEDNDR